MIILFERQVKRKLIKGGSPFTCNVFSHCGELTYTIGMEFEDIISGLWNYLVEIYRVPSSIVRMIFMHFYCSSLVEMFLLFKGFANQRRRLGFN